MKGAFIIAVSVSALMLGVGIAYVVTPEEVPHDDLGSSLTAVTASSARLTGVITNVEDKRVRFQSTLPYPGAEPVSIYLSVQESTAVNRAEGALERLPDLVGTPVVVVIKKYPNTLLASDILSLTSR